MSDSCCLGKMIFHEHFAFATSKVCAWWPLKFLTIKWSTYKYFHCPATVRNLQLLQPSFDLYTIMTLTPNKTHAMEGCRLSKPLMSKVQQSSGWCTSDWLYATQKDIAIVYYANLVHIRLAVKSAEESWDHDTISFAWQCTGKPVTNFTSGSNEMRIWRNAL